MGLVFRWARQIDGATALAGGAVEQSDRARRVKRVGLQHEPRVLLEKRGRAAAGNQTLGLGRRAGLELAQAGSVRQNRLEPGRGVP